MLSRTVLLCACALSLAAGYVPPKPACGYESCTDAAPGALNIHIVANSHDDVGWLQTVDQYYKNDVRKILDSVIKGLLEFPHRRFIYAETVYFWMWWLEQNRETRAKVRQLVNSGRLVFVGGGWSVIDEATTHYQSIIDQLTLGIGKLIEMFGECGVPRTAWQYDAFGHSREFASLHAAMGFDGIFFDRISREDRDNRKHTLSMETLWRGDDDLGNSSDIFTSVMWRNLIDFLPTCSNPLHCSSIKDSNLTSGVLSFIKSMTALSKSYVTRNVLVSKASDFGYRDASHDFRKLDNLIQLTNEIATQHGLNVKAFYSTPACYLKAVKDAQPALPTKQDDFFPYKYGGERGYTGYYSSRPTLKYFEREGNSYLQMAKQLQVLAGLPDDTKFVINELKHAMGVLQHHDAITGTHKQYVTHDFEWMLNRAIEGVLVVPQMALNKMMFGNETATRLLFKRCHLNESRCETSETSEQFVVAVYNPLAWRLKAPIRIPVVAGNYIIYGPEGKEIVSQIVEIPPEVLKISTRNSEATLEIVFIGYFDPLMIKTYYIKKIPETETKSGNIIKFEKKNIVFNNMNGYWKTACENSVDKKVYKISMNRQLDNVFGNKLIHLHLDKTRNKITHVTLSDGTNIKLNIKFCYYPGSGTTYTFIPDVKKPHDIRTTITSVRKGCVVQEMRIASDTASALVKIYDDLKYIENEWVAGPISIKDGKGKDYIIRYVTDIFNDGQFYTDSNGRQTLKRVKSKRPQWKVDILDPVADNYYPVTNKIFIQDDKNRVVVLTDRSEGVTSLEKGQIELMLHRRHQLRIAFALLNEPLNETANGQGLVVRGKHRILITKLGSSKDKVEEKKQVFQMHLQPHVFIANAETLRETDGAIPYDMWMSLTKAESFANELPDGVHLLTLESWDESNLLLRLENFLEKSDNISTIIQVDLRSIFRYIQVISFRETNLSGHQLINNKKKLTWKIRDNFVESFNENYGSKKTAKHVRKDKGFKEKEAWDVGLKDLENAEVLDASELDLCDGYDTVEQISETLMIDLAVCKAYSFNSLNIRNNVTPQVKFP